MTSPAERTIERYFAATRAGDREAWVACFAPDAVSYDPVGSPPLVGHDALRRFFDSITGSVESIGLDAVEAYPCGAQIAVKWVGRGTSRSGRSFRFEGIDVFECGPDGRIRLLKAFWDPAQFAAQLG